MLEDGRIVLVKCYGLDTIPLLLSEVSVGYPPIRPRLLLGVWYRYLLQNVWRLGSKRLRLGAATFGFVLWLMKDQTGYGYRVR